MNKSEVAKESSFGTYSRTSMEEKPFEVLTSGRTGEQLTEIES
jgi:hypothetical protein